jgi:hypothetical protein
MSAYTVGHCPASEMMLLPYLAISRLRRLVESYLPVSITQLHIIRNMLHERGLVYDERMWESDTRMTDGYSQTGLCIMTLRISHPQYYTQPDKTITNLLKVHCGIVLCRSHGGFQDC